MPIKWQDVERRNTCSSGEGGASVVRKEHSPSPRSTESTLRSLDLKLLLVRRISALHARFHFLEQARLYKRTTAIILFYENGLVSRSGRHASLASKMRLALATTTLSVACRASSNEELAADAPRFVYLLHIPKTAGQSLYRDLPSAINCTSVLPRFGYDRRRPYLKGGGRRLSVGKKRSKGQVAYAPDTYAGEMVGLLRNEGYNRAGCNLYHAEGVWEIADDFRAIAPGEPARVVTLIRDPTLHVISLYEHNKHSGFDTRHMAYTQYAQPSLAQWLEIAIAGNTSQIGTQHNPFNMQTARLSGTRGNSKRTRLGVYPRKGYLYRSQLKPDLRLALRHVRADAWFVGITEFYRESLCLLRELALSELPQECLCRAHEAMQPADTESQPPSQLTETYNRHHARYVPPSSSKPERQMRTRAVRRYDDHVYSGAELKLIADATRLDRILYGAAIVRFMQQLLDTEKRHGGQIVCRDGRERLSLRPSPSV